MITKPNTVLIASSVALLTADATTGALVVIDAKTGKVVADAEALSSVESIQLGVVKDAAATGNTNAALNHPMYIAKTKAFTKSELLNISNNTFKASAEDTFTYTLPTDIPTDILKDEKLHVRLDYVIAGIQGQKAEEYVFDINAYATTDAIATAIANRINNNPDSWVTATVAGKVVTVTAKKAIDYQTGAKNVNALSNFNQVSFKMAAFRVYGTFGYKALGTVAHTVAATPGFGNPYVVRDEEKAAFGYLGALHSTVYPNAQPASSIKSVGGLVDATAQYGCISFEAELKYRAVDESYMKSTGVSAQIYYPNAESADAVKIVNAIKAWATI